MKRKFFENKKNPLICKKRSKNSKKKQITCEYEKSISTLLKNMTLSDVKNSSNCSSKKLEPFNDFGLETSMGNKFLRYNLRQYSSCSSSRSLNICKKSESKCIRFISIGSYLQGNISRNPHITNFERKEFSPIPSKKNKHVLLKPKSLFKNENNFKLKNNILIRGNFGEVSNLEQKLLSPDIMSKTCKMLEHGEHKQHFFSLNILLNDIPDIPYFYTKPFDSIKRFILTDQLNLRIATYISDDSLFSSYKRYCHLLAITYMEKLRTTTKNKGYSSESVTNYQLLKDLPKEDIDSSISNLHLTLDDRLESVKITIMEILMTDLRIESYQSIFRQHNYESFALKDINKIKVKSGRLLKKCYLLVDELYQSNYLHKALKVHREQKKILDINISHASKSDIVHRSAKRNHLKRKRKVKNIVTPKRSKLLDDCIKRACATKCLPQKHKIISVTNSECEKLNYKYRKIKRIKQRVELVDDFPDNSGLVENHTVPADSDDEENKRRLHNLPPLEESVKCNEPTVHNDIDLSNLTSIIHYDRGNGRKLVILPYVDI